MLRAIALPILLGFGAFLAGFFAGASTERRYG